jgi:hypothetical protein
VESSKRSGVFLWASIAAAATGIIAVAAIRKWKEHAMERTDVSSHLRDVQDVLTDCYQKIREIEDHLPNILAPNSSALSPRSKNRNLSNGNPILEA